MVEVGFYGGEGVDCATFRELYKDLRLGLVEDGLAFKLGDHREGCMNCQLWIAENALKLFE